MKPYTYHDIDDEITIAFIREHEPYAGYWAESEERALKEVAAYLTSRLSSNKSTEALDIGCGEGRLVPWLATFAQNIVAVDPDEKRLEIAKSAYNSMPGATTTFYVGDFATNEEHRFDLTMCSHILQHIQSNTITSSLEKMYDVTKPGGFLIVSYCKQTKADKNAGEYFFDTLQNGKGISSPITEEKFNSYIMDGTTEGLPVHHLNPLWLREQAKTIGWEPQFSWSFHAVESDSELRGKDDEINGAEEHKLGYGRDIIEIWQKLS